MCVFTRENVAKYVSEFAGTMFLIMFVKLGSTYDTYTAALSIGLGLALVIYNYGYVSGGHLNPNISIAVFCQQLPSFSDPGHVAMYIVSQFGGGLFGGLAAWVIGGETAAAAYPTIYASSFDEEEGMRLFRALVGETFFTFLLCSTVLHVAVDPRGQPNQYYALCIGLALSLGVACIGPISGSCLNTSVWLGTVVPALLTGQTKKGLRDLWVYWVGTTLGGVIAGLWFRLMYESGAPPRADAEEKQKQEVEVAMTVHTMKQPEAPEEAPEEAATAAAVRKHETVNSESNVGSAE